MLLTTIASQSANAALTLDSEFLKISISSNSGGIETVAVVSGGDEATEFATLLDGGDLLALSRPVDSTLRSQEMRGGPAGERMVASVFEFTDGVILDRILSLGATPYTIRINYKLSNQSTETLSLGAGGATHLVFGSGFEGISDPLGGYASSIYSYMNSFFSKAAEPARVFRMEGEEFPSSETVEWFGWLNRYHLIALRGTGGNGSSKIALASLVSTDSSAEGLTVPQQIGLFPGKPVLLQPGNSMEFAFEIVAAPKSKKLLAGLDVPLDSAVLMNLWDWFRWICLALAKLLLYLFSVTGNWGVTLILAALIVRILTIPVTRISLQYQERASAQQEIIQPKLQSIKKNYSGLELSQQMVDLYEKEDFDHLLPFKSMLGLFIQIPILIALFNVLAETPELGNASFLWINDLSVSDRLFSLGINLPFFGGYFNLLPFAMAFVTVVSSYYARRVKGSVKGDLQYGALFGMAGVFFVLFYTFPAALVLYWTASNFFQLLQQVIENRFS